MKRVILCAIAVLIMAAPAMALVPNFEGWEDSGWVQDTTRINTWRNATRVTSGTNGITSFNGSAHGQIMPGELWAGSGSYSAGTYHGGAMTGTWVDHKIQLAVYFDLSDPNITDGEWWFEIDSALSANGGNYAQAYVMHAYNDAATDTVLIYNDNNSYGTYQTPGYVRNPAIHGNDLYEVSVTGWYVLEWDFYDNAGKIAADGNVIDTTSTSNFMATRGNYIDTSVANGNHVNWTCSASGMDWIAVDDSQTIGGVIPEPASLALLGLGGLMLLRRRR